MVFGYWDENFQSCEMFFANYDFRALEAGRWRGLFFPVLVDSRQRRSFSIVEMAGRLEEVQRQLQGHWRLATGSLVSE